MRIETSARRQGSAKRIVPLVMVSVLLTSSACSGLDDTAPSSQEARLPAPAAELAFTGADATTPVRPDQRLSVAAGGGELVTVRLIGPDDELVSGSVADGSWSTSAQNRLTPDAEYRWSAAARNEDGQITREELTFRTLAPKIDATYYVTPDEATVGVGMPVMVTFDSAVGTPQMRADVEARMSIKTVPAQEGSWGWLDERQLMWRPATYWKPGTKVTVNAPLTGVQTGEDKWVGKSKGASFTVSDRARISTVDLAGHTMTVREDGDIVARYPISGGKPTDEWETRSGTKIITEMHRDYVMDAATLGVEEDHPDYYKLEVRHAMRVTNTGEFLHGAPWSTWAQGRRNVSHGCVNLGPRDAREVFDQSLIGDVVDFKGSGRQMKAGDGVSVWIFSYADWAKRSALAAPDSAKSTANASSSPAAAPTTSTPTPSPTATGDATSAPS